MVAEGRGVVALILDGILSLCHLLDSVLNRAALHKDFLLFLSAAHAPPFLARHGEEQSSDQHGLEDGLAGKGLADVKGPQSPVEVEPTLPTRVLRSRSSSRCTDSFLDWEQVPA